jgi:ABC-type uncharacterized transport system ATPase subunit
VLAVHELVKHFGHVKANDGIHLEFRSSEIHALLGENGAGKSTLIKVLAGIYAPDSGTITLAEQPIVIDNAMAARRHGISVVHQDSMLVSQLTVLENVVLQEGGSGRIAAGLADRLAASEQRLGFKLDPRAPVAALTPGDRQRAEIARALMSDARFLILDEPTAVLSPQEKTAFFTLLKTLAADGIGVIFVTHHIGDALEYSDRVTVLRGGRVVGQPRQPSAPLTEDGVVRMMVGDVDFRDGRAPAEPGEEVLVVNGMGGHLEGGRVLEDITFSVRAGEVLGIAGVEGDGQREVAAALTGAWAPEHGTVAINGRDIHTYSSAERAKLVADVPDDQLLGTVQELSLWENAGLTDLSWRRGRTPREKSRLRRWAADLVEAFGIRTASVNAPVGQLSGGNRRRVVLARELSKEPALAVLAFATKGLDIRSVEQVKEWTRRLAIAGTAVVYISADLEEVLAISDRIAVLAHGQIRGILDGDQATVQAIGRLMLGASSEARTVAE